MPLDTTPVPLMSHRIAPRPGRIFALATSVFLALGLAACGSEDGGERWDVIVVTMDTTRADFLSCYGKREKAKTPTMDAIAAEGVRFENARSVCSVTPVSHASILTGKYQYNHGVRVIGGAGGFYLPDDVPHLGEILKGYSWNTLAVQSAFPVSSHFGFERGFDRFDDVDTEMENDANGMMQWDWHQFQRRSDVTIDRTIKYLRDVGDQPYFLWLHLWDPHDMGKLPPDAYIEQNDPDKTWSERWPKSKRWLRRYEVEVQYMDEQLGRLVDELKQRGTYDKTLIVPTADPGEGLGEHAWMSHRLVYEEQLDIPLIIKWPGGPEGKVVSGVASSVDVLPTVLDAMGIPYDAKTMDGISLVESIEKGVVPDRVTYADQINGYDTNAGMVLRRPQADFLYAVSDGDWKLTWRPSYPHNSELFDLKNDPDEEHNRFGAELEVQRRLVRELASRKSWVTAPIQPLPGHEQSEADLRALEALGYTGARDDDGNLILIEFDEDSWTWGCAEHLDVLVEDRDTPCPTCGAPCLLRTVTDVKHLPPPTPMKRR